MLSVAVRVPSQEGLNVTVIVVVVSLLLLEIEVVLTEYADVLSHSIYVAFPVRDGKGVVDQDARLVIWTTHTSP